MLVLAESWAGVVRGGVTPWPPAELLQKAYKKRGGGASRMESRVSPSAQPLPADQEDH
jgi:hypothetical protein